ncbi:MAG: ribosome assembly RNA-binding protein YhbY [Candidatus Hydrogenedentes bacterium]|nr:ribosome assembly RNA-binding protein YhbY [Candidatus Hydrogenedentota bacterium]
MPLSSSQRDALKRMAHHLKPTVYVGKQGVTPTVVKTTDEVLLAQELIKVKFNDRKDEKRVLTDTLARETQAQVVGILGNIATLYRPHPEEEKRRIDLPR